MDVYKKSIELHEKFKGKIEISTKFPIKNKEDLSIAYTPGVAEICSLIKKDKNLAYKYTLKNNSLAMISDGSAVLGFGNIGALASIPVIEGKCMLLKEFANVDAFPICVETQETEEIINIIKNITPVFGAINLEDISAPRCFEIYEETKDMGIPLMHDDQHGTEVVVSAALRNACKVTGKNWEDLRVVVNGAGAAGIAISRSLLAMDSKNKISVGELALCDSKGIVSKDRGDLNKYKAEVAKVSGSSSGSLQDAIKGADVFIGVSVGGILSKEMVSSMKDPIIFAMANPYPEIMPQDAIDAGAVIVATGRSDFPNQVNNVLAFPGIFRGSLDAKATKITVEMREAAAQALSDYALPVKEKLLPFAFDRKLTEKVAEAVKKKAEEQGVIRSDS